MRQEDMRAAKLLGDPNTIGTTLLVQVLDRFGLEVLDWEPQTLLMEIERSWKLEPPQFNMDKIWALMNVMSTNLFHTSLEFFIHVCNALSDHVLAVVPFGGGSSTSAGWGVLCFCRPVAMCGSKPRSSSSLTLSSRK